MFSQKPLSPHENRVVFPFYLQTRFFVPGENGPREAAQCQQQLVNHVKCFSTEKKLKEESRGLAIHPPKQTAARAVAGWSRRNAKHQGICFERIVKLKKKSLRVYFDNVMKVFRSLLCFESVKTQPTHFPRFGAYINFVKYLQKSATFRLNQS